MIITIVIIIDLQHTAEEDNDQRDQLQRPSEQVLVRIIMCM